MLSDEAKAKAMVLFSPLMTMSAAVKSLEELMNNMDKAMPDSKAADAIRQAAMVALFEVIENGLDVQLKAVIKAGMLDKDKVDKEINDHVFEVPFPVSKETEKKTSPVDELHAQMMKDFNLPS